MINLVALEQSGIIMLIGMAVVFLFLTLLIFVINATSFLGRKLGWGDAEDDGGDAQPALVVKNDDEAVAAMAAATAHHAKS